MAIEIKVRKGDTIEKALKKLKKTLDRENILRGLRDKRYHIKECEKRRRKKKELAFRDMLRNKRERM